MLISPSADDVNRHDLIVRREGGGERGIVSQPQIAAKPMEGEGHRSPYARRARADALFAKRNYGVTLTRTRK